MTAPIYRFIKEYLKTDTVSFHMPGHKGSNFFRRFGYGDFLDNLMDYDITEIAGADNLFQTEGVIKAAQDNYAKLYGVKKSYLLINGSSGGNIAAILASVHKGKKLIMARNCHKSVFNALALGDIQPIYAYPEMIEEYQISGVVTPEEIQSLIIEHPEADAVFITNPNYYGICSDIRAIASVAHKHGKVLIVDEAHGAHLKFSDELPISAVDAGADLVINSTHKTLGSFTQSAMLHFNSELMNPTVLEDKLQCIESTSPSYLLMASLDITAAIIEKHGLELMSDWIKNLNEFYNRIEKIPGLKTMGKLEGHDWTKINISFGSIGISGAELDRILMEDYSIYTELYTGDLVMALTGIGNIKDDYDRFVLALEDISKKYYENSVPLKHERLALPKQAQLFEIPKEKRKVNLSDSEGLICASSIIPYPPGIPLLCPGERIEADAIAYIQALRNAGEKVIGVNSSGEVLVG